jgi:hypothetical protein
MAAIIENTEACGRGRADVLATLIIAGERQKPGRRITGVLPFVFDDKSTINIIRPNRESGANRTNQTSYCGRGGAAER